MTQFGNFWIHLRVTLSSWIIVWIGWNVGGKACSLF